MNQKFIEKAGNIIAQRTGKHFDPKTEPYCTLGLIDQYGCPTVSTLTAADAEGIETLYFSTGLSSRKVARIRKNQQASVCFSGLDYNITLVGSIEISTDPALKKAMWYPPLSQHFNSDEDPNYCILVFKTKRYSFLLDWQEITGQL